MDVLPEVNVIIVIGVVINLIVFIFAILLIIVNIKKENNTNPSVNLIMNYELNIAFILHSFSFFIVYPENSIAFICNVQAIISVSSLIIIISIVASMSAIAYQNFTHPGKVEKYRNFVLCLHFLYSWILPVGMTLFFLFVENPYTNNYLYYCWINDNKRILTYIFYGYYLVSFLFFVVSMLMLRYVVNKFLNEFGKKEEYQIFIDRLKYYYFAIIATVIVCCYNLFDAGRTSNEANAKYDIFTIIAFITETLLIPIYLVSFAFNAKKIEYLKEFIFCAVKEEAEEKKQLTEIADANESGDNLNITIY